jgi:polar amino acid transport system substrate-binding protein
MKKIAIILGFLAAFLAADDINLWKKSTLNAITARGELLVGLEPGYLPFEMKTKKGEIIGFDVDVAQAIADNLGVKLRIVPTDFDGLVNSLLTSKFDLIISAMTITQERNLKINFSAPYTTIGQTLLLNKKHEGKTWKEIDKPGAIITTKLGVTGEIVAKRMFKHAKVKTFGTETEGIQEVVNGNADAWIYDKPFNDMFIASKGKGLVYHLHDELTYEPLAIGFRHGDPDLMNWLDNFINQIKHDGTYDRIYDKWFNSDKWLPQVM